MGEEAFPESREALGWRGWKPTLAQSFFILFCLFIAEGIGYLLTIPFR